MDENKKKKFGPYLNHLNQNNTKKELGLEHRKHHFTLGIQGKFKCKISKVQFMIHNIKRIIKIRITPL